MDKKILEGEWTFNFDIPDYDGPEIPILSVRKVQIVRNFLTLKDSNKIDVIKSQKFPVMTATLLIEEAYMCVFQKNQNNIKVNVQLHEFERLIIEENGEQVIAPNDSETKELVLEATMLPIFNQVHFRVDKYSEEALETIKMQKDDPDAMRDYPHPSSGQLGTLEMTLYPITTLLAEKTVVGGNFRGKGGAKLTALGAAKYCAFKTGLNYVIDPGNPGLREFGNIQIFPNRVSYALEMIQSYYGIYGTGIRAFFDYDAFYLLEKYRFNHEYIEGETPYSYISIHKDPPGPDDITTEAPDGCLDYHIKGPVKVTDLGTTRGEKLPDYVVFSNFSLAYNSLEYTEGAISNAVNPLAIVKRKAVSHSDTGNIIAFTYDDFNNIMNIGSIMADESVQRFVTVMMNNVSFKSFKANKNFKLQYHDNPIKEKELGGEYLHIFSTIEWYNRSKLPSNKRMTGNAMVGLIKHENQQ